VLGRIMLTLGALVLLSTAAFHATGAESVGGWLGGERGVLLQVLWLIPTLDWAAVALAWLVIAWRGSRRAAPLVWVLAAIPAGAAAMIAATLGPEFLGLWLLAGASLLAVLGSVALPEPRPRS